MNQNVLSKQIENATSVLYKCLYLYLPLACHRLILALCSFMRRPTWGRRSAMPVFLPTCLTFHLGFLSLSCQLILPHELQYHSHKLYTIVLEMY
jgi:hypothetical protein